MAGVIAIADYYDWLTCRSQLEMGDYPEKDALVRLQEMEGRFDPEIRAAFIEMMENVVL